MPKPCSPIRIWIAVAVVLGAIAISLMGVVIHLKTSEPSCAEDSESELFEKYLYLFRTEEEQLALEAAFPAYIVNHACCRSTQMVIRPPWAITIYNTNVTVYQNVTIRGRTFYQYFIVDNCTQSAGQCPLDCTCQLTEGYFTAYVWYQVPVKANISQIRLRSCCKCVNRPL